MKTIHYLLLSLTLISGCIKKADIDLPKIENKLVVTCFISPEDSVIGAVVRLSIPRFGINGTPTLAVTGQVKNARIEISDGSTSALLPFNQEAEFYKLSSSVFPIVRGKKYYLNVSTPDGKSVSASTTVPDSPFEIESVKTSLILNEPNKIETDVEMLVKDIPSQKNYLGVFFYQTSIPANTEDPFNVFGYFDTDEKVSKSSYYHYSGTTFYHPENIQSATLHLSVLNCSKEFYLYSKSVQEAGIASLNPFGDPVMVYTNISDGFGCFGAYVGNYQTLKIR